ncbi:UNVERIFIED_CONTAM: hypothetical protein Q9R58_24165 [Methylobacteriaceae bacterium AG10]|nr:hypothetical protein [Methylobacteriaceae bacterium AG10]
MTITTKAALADELGISRARVSQYVRDGLPVRSDGKLNRDEALNWLNQYGRGLNTGADRGVNRAARLAKPKPARPKPAEPAPQLAEEWADEVVEITALAELVGNAGAIAAKVAVEAGATMQVAAILDAAVTHHLWTLADRLIGLPEGPGVSPFEAMVDRRIVQPDWAALADAAGEVVDHDAWDAAIDALPFLQPKPPEDRTC